MDLKIGVAAKGMVLTEWVVHLLNWNGNRCEIIWGRGNRLDVDRSLVVGEMRRRNGSEGLVFVDSDIMPLVPIEDCYRYARSAWAHGYDIVSGPAVSPEGRVFMQRRPGVESDGTLFDVTAGHMGFTWLSPQLIKEMDAPYEMCLQDDRKVPLYFWNTPQDSEDFNFYEHHVVKGKYRALVDMRMRVAHYKPVPLGL